MKFIFFDWNPERQDKKYFYAIPLKPGWAEILAEWEADIRAVMPSENQDEIKLYIGEVDPEYEGKVYWGHHQEVGANNELKEHLINEEGKSLNKLDDLVLNPEEM